MKGFLYFSTKIKALDQKGGTPIRAGLFLIHKSILVYAANSQFGLTDALFCYEKGRVDPSRAGEGPGTGQAWVK